MKWLFKWLFRLFLLAVVSIVILLLSLNSILRVYVEHRIRAQTGMDAEIGKFSLDLIEPTVTIRNFKLYNSPGFGGTQFLDIREIHAEYDRTALAKNKLHITLLRFNLAELDIVIASLHASLRQPRDVITARLLKAIHNPHVDIIGQ